MSREPCAVSHQLASALGVPELPLAPAADGSKTAAEAKDDEEKMVGRQTGERYDPTAVEPTSASGGGGRNRMTQEQSRQETLPQGVVQGTQAIEQAERDAIEKEEAKLREAQEEIERLVKEQELQMQVSCHFAHLAILILAILMIGKKCGKYICFRIR